MNNRGDGHPSPLLFNKSKMNVLFVHYSCAVLIPVLEKTHVYDFGSGVFDSFATVLAQGLPLCFM